MQYASKHMNMHTSNATNQVHELASPSCVLFFVKEFWSYLLPLDYVHVHTNTLSSPFVITYPKIISYRQFHIFVHLSPFVINNHKRYASFDTKGGTRGGWLILESSFLMDTTICWNDTTCNYHMWKHEDHLEMPHVGHL